MKISHIGLPVTVWDEEWRVSTAPPTKTRGIDVMTGYNKFALHVPFSQYMTGGYEEAVSRAKLAAAAPDLYRAGGEALMLLKILRNTGVIKNTNDVANAIGHLERAYRKAGP